MASLEEIFGVTKQSRPDAKPTPAPSEKPQRSLQDIFGMSPPGGGAARSMTKLGKEQFTQQEEGIDYKSGGKIASRLDLQRASNPDEAKLVLENSYGAGNYGQDKFGNWWVKQGDKKVAVLPRGFAGGLQNIATGAVAGGWPTAGAVIGGVIGAPEGGAGAIPGAMIGAAAGKGIEDLIKWTEGKFKQSAPEVVSGISREGAVAGAFQGAAPIAGKVGQGIRSGMQRFTGTTPTSRAMATDLSAGGAKPPIGSFAPEATSIEYKRQLRNMLAGNPAESANIAYLTGRLNRILEQEGVGPQERERVIDEIYNTSSRSSTRAAGEAITGEANRVHSALLKEHEDIQTEVARRLQETDANLRKITQQRDAAGQPLPATDTSLGKDVAGAIKSARRDFSKQMADVYKSADRMAGDQPIVPTALIQQSAKDLAHIMPPQALPPIIKQWAEKAPNGITFEQAHALRTTLREMGETIDVSPSGQRIGNFKKMAAAVNQSIQDAEGLVGRQAAAALRAADKQYAEGIAKFNSTDINRIVREMRSGIIPEAQTVANLVMDPGNVNLAKTVFSMLPQNVKDNVVRADLKTVIDQATRYTDRGEALMDGASLRKILDSRKNLMDATYPPNSLAVLRKHAAELAAFDGQVDVSALRNPTDITNLLQRGVGAMRAADEFVKMNPLGALVNGTPVQVDRALARLTMPGNESTTLQAARTLGIDSDAWKKVRSYALQRTFAQAVEEKQSLAKTISGTAIDSTLNRYTKQQQDLLFPGGLADDMRLLAKEAKFLFPENQKDLGTSLAAASIKSGLWLNPIAVTKYITKSISGYIADHPRVLRYLAGEIRRDPKYARSAMGVLGQWLTDRAINGGPGHGAPADDIGLRSSLESRGAQPPAQRPTYGGTVE
jgi:hypothetical protein